MASLLYLSPGLFVGKEGPMIHSGAVVGAGLPQVRADGLGRCIPLSGLPGRGMSQGPVRDLVWKKSIGNTLT